MSPTRSRSLAPRTLRGKDDITVRPAAVRAEVRMKLRRSVLGFVMARASVPSPRTYSRPAVVSRRGTRLARERSPEASAGPASPTPRRPRHETQREPERPEEHERAVEPEGGAQHPGPGQRTGGAVLVPPQQRLGAPAPRHLHVGLEQEALVDGHVEEDQGEHGPEGEGELEEVVERGRADDAVAPPRHDEEPARHGPRGEDGEMGDPQAEERPFPRPERGERQAAQGERDQQDDRQVAPEEDGRPP